MSKLTIVAEQEALQRALAFCHTGAQGPKTSPDTNVMAMKLAKDNSRMMIVTRNAYIQTRAVVDLQQPTALDSKVVMDHDKIQNVIKNTKPGERVVMQVDNPGVDATIMHMKTAHGSYQFGLLDPEEFYETTPKIKEVGTVSAADMITLFDDARIMNGNTQFVRFQATKQKPIGGGDPKMYLQILLKTGEHINLFTVESPDINTEFMAFLPADTLRDIQKLSATDVRIGVPVDPEDSTFIAFMNEDKTIQLVLACDMEPNQNIDDAIARLRVTPDKTLKWNVKEMEQALKRLSNFSSGDIQLTVNAHGNKAALIANNNKFSASEDLEIECTPIAENESATLQLSLDTINRIHKLDNQDDIEIKFQHLEMDDDTVTAPVELGLITGIVDNVYFRSVFSASYVD